MNWIRVAVGIMHDRDVDAMAVACGVRVAEIVGCIVGVLTHLPDDARDGDVSGTSDRLLERWASWEGKRGRFAVEFRARLCTESGVVRSWDKHNGRAIREADQTRERVRAWREQKKASVTDDAGKRVTERVTSPVPNAVRTHLRDVTGRDELLTATEKPSRRAAAPRRESDRDAAAFPAFGKPLCDAAYQAWLSKAGAVPYGRFRKAFGPLFAQHETERPAAFPCDIELVPAIGLYLDATFGQRDAAFRSPERCAAALSGLVDVMRATTDGEKRLDGAQMVIGVQRPRVA